MFAQTSLRIRVFTIGKQFPAGGLRRAPAPGRCCRAARTTASWDGRQRPLLVPTAFFGAKLGPGSLQNPPLLSPSKAAPPKIIPIKIKRGVWLKIRRKAASGSQLSPKSRFGRCDPRTFAYRATNEASNRAEFPSFGKELVIPRNNKMFSLRLPRSAAAFLEGICGEGGN